jgi:hypothetical protein
MAGVAVIAILFECALIYNRMLVYRTFVPFHEGHFAVYGPMANALADNRRWGLKSDPPDIAEKAAARAENHRQTGDKYEWAARRPWRSVPPDPPIPPYP